LLNSSSTSLRAISMSEFFRSNASASSSTFFFSSPAAAIAMFRAVASDAPANFASSSERVTASPYFSFALAS
jgi:hypothetical protein